MGRFGCFGAADWVNLLYFIDCGMKGRFYIAASRVVLLDFVHFLMVLIIIPTTVNIWKRTTNTNVRGCWVCWWCAFKKYIIWHRFLERRKRPRAVRHIPIAWDYSAFFGYTMQRKKSDAGGNVDRHFICAV